MVDVIPARPAIEGCDDFWEEIALVLAVQAEAPAAALARRAELRDEIAGLKAALPEQQQVLAAAQATHTDAVEAYNAIAKPPLFLPVSGVASLALAAITLLLVILPDPPALLAIPAVVVVAAFGAYILVWRHQRSKAAETVAKTADAVAPLALAVRSTAERLQACEHELGGITLERTVTALGRCYLAAEVRNLGGYAVLVDRSGVVPPAKFTLADMTYDATELSDLVANIDGLRDPPVLLSPSQSVDHDHLEQLHGQELHLRQTVERFSHFVHAIPVVQQALSLLPRSSGLARLASSLQRCRDGVFGPIVSGTLRDEGHHQAIAALQRAIEWSRSRGSSAKEELLSAYSAIKDLLVEYRGLRTVSVQQLHSHLMSAVRRSSLCSVLHLCPRMTGNARWMLSKLHIDLDSVPDTPLDEIMGYLWEVPEAAERLRSDPSLVQRMEDAWSGVAIANGAIARHTAAANDGLSVPGGGAEVATGSTASMLQKYRDHLGTLQTQCRNLLMEALFGTTSPLFEATHAARLTYDPARRLWTNTVTGDDYPEDEHLQFCRTTRAHLDLKVPIWSHLWTEKSDFRKSELFRSNESVLRMSEKESEKLIEIGNQFRADMRSIRESAQESISLLRAKSDQIADMADRFRHLMDADELDRLSRLQQRLRGGGGDVLRDAERKESFLSLEPQAQADRRPRMEDPIHAVAGLDHLAVPALPAAMARVLMLPAPSQGEEAHVE